MEDQNSLAVYTSLAMQLYQDIAQSYISVRELKRELLTIEKRSLEEGFSFFTKTLPSFGKAVDKALSNGTPLQAPMFRKRRGSVIPVFCGWLLEELFDDEGYPLLSELDSLEARMKDNTDVRALLAFRQFVYFVYKLQVPYGDDLNNEVINRFIQVEAELVEHEFDPRDSIIKRARNFVSRLFAGFDARDIVPKHGPGAVATGEKGGEKSYFSRLYTHAERYYPFSGYFTLGVSQIADTLDKIGDLQVLEHGTAKVVLVPKDSRGPRLISCEPLELQWLQQGLLRKLVPWIEGHRLTKGHVNFTDQTANRRLALSGSLTNRWVTLDMKDASDRVSLRLVEELFAGTELLEALKATRSSETRLPDGIASPKGESSLRRRTVQLKKFAPMGSAVCFPVESIVFYALAVATLTCYGWTSRDARAAVYVYGDDLIVRPEAYRHLLKHFPRYALRFNESKCCVTGLFRESCGCDAYKGVDVTPIRLRMTWGRRGTMSASEVQSYVEISNHLHIAGYFGTAELIKQMVESRYGPLPVLPVPRTSQRSLGRVEISDSQELLLAEVEKPLLAYIAFYRYGVDHRVVNKAQRIRYRWNRHLHRAELATWVIRSKRFRFRADGWEAVLRSLNCGSTGLPTGLYTLPRRSKLIRGWIPVLY